MMLPMLGNLQMTQLAQLSLSPEHFLKGIGSIQLVIERPPYRQTKQKVTIYPNVLVHC